MRIKAAGLALILMASSSLWAQPAPAAAGHWEGEIEAPDRKIGAQFDIAVEGSKWYGTMSVPEQNMRGLPLADVEFKDGVLTFGMKGVPGDPKFKGTVAKEGGAIAGEFTQSGFAMPLKLKRTGDAKVEKPVAIAAISKELAGTWEGTLEFNNRTYRLRFILENLKEGGAKGTLISLDQGASEIPLSQITQTGSKVKLEVPVVSGGFNGELKDTQMTGEWSQGGASLPLTLTKAK
jgi:hypothetical protein